MHVRLLNTRNEGLIKSVPGMRSLHIYLVVTSAMRYECLELDAYIPPTNKAQGKEERRERSKREEEREKARERKRL